MHDRSSIWIGLADLLLCIVSVVIVAVSPTHAKTDGIRPKAEYLISADWDVMLDSDVDLWLANPSRKPVSTGLDKLVAPISITTASGSKPR